MQTHNFDEVLVTQNFNLDNGQNSGYASAQPFAHAVIDGLVNEQYLANVLAEFPNDQSEAWDARAKSHSVKKSLNQLEKMGAHTQALIQYLNSPRFLTYLEKLTNIQGLIPDPYLLGGGLHRIERGGHLKVHVDFNQHKQLRLERRVNLLLYLNQDWDASFEGCLELWDSEVTQCVKKISPEFNRCVVFSTTDSSYHGHPEPLACPEGMARKSIALYYYTAPQDNELKDHPTLWKDRPEERTQKGRFLGLFKN